MAPRRNVIVVEPDPYLAVTIEALLGDVHPSPELMAVADVDELREWARHSGVVVAGPSTAGKHEIAELQAFRDDYPAVRILLAWDRRPGANMREVVAIGADGLVDPTDTEDLRAGLLRAITLGDALSTELALPDEPGTPGTPLGQVYTVCSPTGGCGKTFYSTNAAFTLSRYSTGRVVIIDLDLQFGEVLTALRLRPRNTIVDAIAITDDDELADLIPELLTAHEGGVWVLPAPMDPAEADSIEPQDVLRVIAALRNHFDYIVVDTPTGLNESVLAALDQSDHLFVLAALDLSSVRNLRLFTQTLERLRIPNENISLVLNKDQRGMGIEADQVEKLFPAGFLGRIPFSNEVPRSMNTGVPLVIQNPAEPVSRTVVESLVPFLPDDAAASARADLAANTPKRWWQRVFSGRPATEPSQPPGA